MKYNASGVHPDPEKVVDLHNMATPTSKELQTFLGFIQFLAPFIPNLSERNHLCYMTSWRKTCPSCGRAITKPAWKKSNKQSWALRYFDTAKLPTLQTDTSIKGLGASLIQDGQPIAYASKALSDAETRYTCTEQELLAVVFSIQRIHTYLYGRPFKVITDHKPLVMILNKPLTSAEAAGIQLYHRTPTWINHGSGWYPLKAPESPKPEGNWPWHPGAQAIPANGNPETTWNPTMSMGSPWPRSVLLPRRKVPAGSRLLQHVLHCPQTWTEHQQQHGDQSLEADTRWAWDSVEDHQL